MKPNQNIIARKLKGETVLLNMDNGDYFTLNEMGTRIYDLICRGIDIEDITDTLLEEYDVGRDRLASDIAGLVEEMRQKNIILDK